MALTRLSDIFEPKPFNDYMAKDTSQKTAFLESGIIVRTPQLDALANGPGKVIDMPFWKDLANEEPDYVNDDPAVLSVPSKITTGDQIARKAFLHKSWSDADLVAEIAGADPIARISARVTAYWERQKQSRVMAIVKGLAAANVAQNAGDMIVDIANDAVGVPAAGELFSRSAFTAAAFTLGDAFANTGAIAVHSRVYKRMIDNDDIDFVSDSSGLMTVPTFLGRRVLIDDGMPAVAGTNRQKFTSVLFGAGAFGYGEGSPEVPVALERKEDGGNGGGIEVLHSRKTWLLHPAGYAFKSVTVAGMSPSLSELALPANWERVYAERKQLPFAFLVTNG